MGSGLVGVGVCSLELPALNYKLCQGKLTSASRIHVPGTAFVTFALFGLEGLR